MKFDIRKISDSYINVTAKEGTTSIDMDWIGKDEAKALLDSLNSTCEDLRSFIGLDDPRTPLLDGLKDALEFGNEGDWEGARESIHEALIAAGEKP